MVHCFLDIDFKELKQKLETNEITLIDVRFPNELQEVGKIPKSKNITCMYDQSILQYSNCIRNVVYFGIIGCVMPF